MQEVPPIDPCGIDESATHERHWIDFIGYANRTGDLRSATRLSDFYTARRWHSTVAHTDAFRHAGLEHVLQLWLPGPFGPAAWPCGAPRC